MRHQEKSRTVPQFSRIQSLRRWLRRPLAIITGQQYNKKENNELHTLSEHLLADLGFAQNGQPLQWSSFSPERLESDCYKLVGEERIACLQNLAKLQKSCCQ